MTRKISPMPGQVSTRDRIIKIIEERVGRKAEATRDLVELAGFPVHWRRVTWTGGVGSFQWMPRRRKFRILVNATKSGYSPGKWIERTPVPGYSMDIHIPGKRRGFRYGFCVEV